MGGLNLLLSLLLYYIFSDTASSTPTRYASAAFWKNRPVEFFVIETVSSHARQRQLGQEMSTAGRR